MRWIIPIPKLVPVNAGGGASREYTQYLLLARNTYRDLRYRLSRQTPLQYPFAVTGGLLFHRLAMRVAGRHRKQHGCARYAGTGCRSACNRRLRAIASRLFTVGLISSMPNTDCRSKCISSPLPTAATVPRVSHCIRWGNSGRWELRGA